MGRVLAEGPPLPPWSEWGGVWTQYRCVRLPPLIGPEDAAAGAGICSRGRASPRDGCPSRVILYCRGAVKGQR